jgi:hypothetical protein
MDIHGNGNIQSDGAKVLASSSLTKYSIKFGGVI